MSRINNNTAQIITEYAVILIVVIAVFASMTALVKGAVQARIKDTRDYVIEEVKKAHRDVNGVGGVAYEYEPYYTRESANVTRNARQRRELKPIDDPGVYRLTENFTINVQRESEQLPARAAGPGIPR